MRTLILKHLRRVRILPILRFLSFVVVNPQIVPSEEKLLTPFLETVALRRQLGASQTGRARRRGE